MSFEFRYRTKLEARIRDEIERASSDIVNGGLSSLEAYKAQTSRIRALRDVLEICADVATEVAKD